MYVHIILLKIFVDDILYLLAAENGTDVELSSCSIVKPAAHGQLRAQTCIGKLGPFSPVFILEYKVQSTHMAS